MQHQTPLSAINDVRDIMRHSDLMTVGTYEILQIMLSQAESYEKHALQSIPLSLQRLIIAMRESYPSYL